MKTNYKNFTISQQILFVAIALSIVLLIFLLSFSANQVLESKNAIKAIVNRNRSFGAIEKIDRNFYERFGDVQAYAYNRLAIEAIDSGKATIVTQKFINTMVSYYVLYDLMMIVGADGKAVAVNTTDKNNVPVKTDFLIGKDFSNEEWFRTCTSVKGPEGGAWYSDFMENPLVGQIYNSKGWGMAFVAPIKNDNNEVIGVWYNYASWRDVTQDIRSETEELLKKENPRAFVLITDKAGNVIDAADDQLVLKLKLQDDAGKKTDAEFIFNGLKIQPNDYIIGKAQGKGAYTYKGNNWKAFTFVPKDGFSLSLFFGELFTLSMVTLAILVSGIIMFLLLSRSISNRVKRLKNDINAVSTGELVDVESTTWHDEIGQMTTSLEFHVNGLRKTALFANEIGNGNLDAGFEPLSEKDVLGQSLVSMRNKLLKIKTEDEKRKWITQGLAEFGDKLRGGNDNMTQLCDTILVFLCKYLNANQGGFFIKEQIDKEVFLELISCFAWNRKKHITEKIAPGEGLIGQAWQEGEMIHLTCVPDGFVKIKSGLGELNPNNIILLPLKQNDEVLGVLEMAFFKKIEPHEIELLQRIAESMGSTLASAKINEKTKKLLEQTQEQAEAMRSQEEEMRQNLEEMQSTQEEFHRREKGFIAQIEKLQMSANGIAA